MIATQKTFLQAMTACPSSGCPCPELLDGRQLLPPRSRTVLLSSRRDELSVAGMSSPEHQPDQGKAELAGHAALTHEAI